MENQKKRKIEAGTNESTPKKSKQWRVPKKGNHNAFATFEPGDSGIWASCQMHKEGACTAELKDLFGDYATKIYGDTEEIADGRAASVEDDIEAEIQKEVKSMKSIKKNLFQPVKIDIQCVLFFKTQEPIEPTSFVHRICQDAFDGAVPKSYRWVSRLTPVTRIGKATAKGLGEVAEAVLGPVFHADGVTSKKFAIRPTIRHHNQLKRDDVIRQIAAAVGGLHTVDLKNYDYLILVEIYRNICGMSIVGSDYEKLKRYNLAEIYDPTTKPAIADKEDGARS